MTDQELTQFLAALDKATTPLETEGIQWSRLIHATTGHTVLPFNPDDPVHRQIAGSISTAAEMLIEAANSTQMVDWGVRRVNELGNALEERFSRSLNELGGALRCRGFSQSTAYPDRRITSDDGTVAFLDLKTYDNSSEASRFRSS